MGWFRSLFSGGDKPASTSPATSDLDNTVAAPSPPPAAPAVIRVTTTATTGRETTVEIDLSAASEEPLPSIEEMEREIAVAKRPRRRVARVSKVRGKHFTEHVDEIQALRRAEQYEEALELLFECIAATERAEEIEGNGRAPAYTEWAAMTFRKQKRYGEEVAVIERFFTGQENRARASHTKLMDRLAKARDLRDAALGADAAPACPSCGSILDAVPKARGKCDSCGQQIVVRRIAGLTRIVTPEPVEVLKTQEASLRERRKYPLRGGSWQVDEAARDATAASLTWWLGAEAAMGVTHWRLANEATVRYQTEHDWARAGQVYTDMARFLVEVGRIGSTSRRKERSAHDSATTPVLRWLQTRVTSCSVSPLQRGQRRRVASRASWLPRDRGSDRERSPTEHIARPPGRHAHPTSVGLLPDNSDARGVLAFLKST